VIFPFDPLYLLFLAPALLLAFWAQMRVKSTYAKAQEVPARLSGAAAARHLLDSAGLQEVAIEQVPGTLSDHYDPRHKVLRLSPEVYHNRSMAAVGIAAHEAGHAIQDARHYAPLVIRNAAVPAANFGAGISWIMIIAGFFLSAATRAPQAAQGISLGGLLILGGIGAFGLTVFFQLINLPVEFDASNRAKRQLVEFGIVDDHDMVYVRKVLNAAALTYIAATLQAVLTLLYLILRFTGGGRR